MDRTEMLQLVHAVLDGAASGEERAALDRVLAQDPQARAQFAELERLFGALDGMPRVEPPEGFADDVMAALQRSTEQARSRHQPFAQSGVIGKTGADIMVRAPSKPITARTPSGPIRGRQDMSKRGIWIMSGVAAAVLALFVGTSVDFPASGDKAAGTIVPAERVRNAQPSAADVKLVEPSRTPSPGVPLATGNTNLGAGGNSNLGAGGNSNLGAGGNSNLGAGGNSNLGAGGNSNLGAGGNSNLGAGGNSNLGAGGNSNLGAGGNSNLGAGGNSNLGAAGNSNLGTGKTNLGTGTSNLGAGGNSNLGAGGNSNLGAGGNSNLGGGGNSNLGVAGKSNLGGGGNSNLGSGVAK